MWLNLYCTKTSELSVWNGAILRWWSHFVKCFRALPKTNCNVLRSITWFDCESLSYKTPVVSTSSPEWRRPVLHDRPTSSNKSIKCAWNVSTFISIIFDNTSTQNWASVCLCSTELIYWLKPILSTQMFDFGRFCSVQKATQFLALQNWLKAMSCLQFMSLDKCPIFPWNRFI